MLLREAVQARLQPVLDGYAQELARATGLVVRAGSSFNDALVLYAYVEAARTDDTGVALTVDVQDRKGVITVESDICRDDGHVFKKGPELRISAQDEEQVLVSFDEWLEQMKGYLRENRQYFVDLIR